MTEAHLTAEQLQRYRERLLDAKASAESLLGRTSGEKPVEASGSTIGRLSRMDAMQVQAMSQMSRRQLEVRLQQIDAALISLEAKTYGLCRQCKEPVSTTRLDALPEAPFCIDCQEGFES